MAEQKKSVFAPSLDKALAEKRGSAVLSVEHITKRFGQKTAVRDISFQIQKGSIVGFLGPNGAGKSTTMNVITGYYGMTEGSVFYHGVDLTEEPVRAKRSFGYLPEQPPVYPTMTVREYLDFVFQLKKVAGEPKQAIQAVMEKTKLTDVAGRVIRNLSKGYRQRVGIAQAILGEPDLLILDEPTVGLDPMQVVEFRDLIRDYAKDHAVILSTHILSEVSALCDRILIISGGSLIADATPEELKALDRQKLVTLTFAATDGTLSDKQLMGLLKWLYTANYRLAHKESTTSVAGQAFEAFLKDSDLSRRILGAEALADDFCDGIETVLGALSCVTRVISVTSREAKFTVDERWEAFGALLFTDMGISLLNFSADTLSLEDIFVETVGAGQQNAPHAEEVQDAILKCVRDKTGGTDFESYF